MIIKKIALSLVVVLAFLLIGAFIYDAMLSKPEREILIDKRSHTSAQAHSAVMSAEHDLTPLPSTPTSSDAHKPQLYDFNGVAVDALCFITNFGGDDEPVYHTDNCEETSGYTLRDLPTGFDERFVSAAYESTYTEPDTGETYIDIRGLIAYRALGVVDRGHEQYIAVWIIENSGGSGTFSWISLLKVLRDEQTQSLQYQEVETLSAGDRCMGGVRDAYMDQENMLHYETNETLWSLFYLSGDPDREILQSEQFNSLPFCASCCYGYAEYDQDEFRGVHFLPNDERWQLSESSSEAAQCTDNMIANQILHNGSYMGAEDFGFFIRELEHVCLGRMEGE